MTVGKGPSQLFIQAGIGGVFVNPTGGNLATPSYPQRFFTIQGAEIEMTQKLVKLMGQNKGPDDVFPSDFEMKGKSGFAFLGVDIYNTLFHGDATVTGQDVVQVSESHVIPATPYQITVAPPSSGVFVEDLGVQYVSNITNVLQSLGTSGSPVTGQYTCTSGGLYTFAAADTTLGVLLSYAYSITTGKTLTVFNHVQGYGPYFELWLPMSYQGTNGLHIRKARSSKMGFPMKRDNYVISDFEFECYPDSTGAFYDFYEAV